jgi:hypothetical protein
MQKKAANIDIRVEPQLVQKIDAWRADHQSGGILFRASFQQRAAKPFDVTDGDFYRRYDRTGTESGGRLRAGIPSAAPDRNPHHPESQMKRALLMLLAVVLTAASSSPPSPYSCRLYYNAQRDCGTVGA